MTFLISWLIAMSIQFQIPQHAVQRRLTLDRPWWRVGQGLFREALLDYWQGRCCVTGLAVPPLLRASHIKPWAGCADDDERLDVFNGLLLAPHVDALFDGGWISFEDSGAVIVSGALPAEAFGPLGVSTRWTVAGLRVEHLGYLVHHRARVLRQ